MKATALKLLLLTVSVFHCISVYAHDFKKDGIYYSITSDKTVSVSNNDDKTESYKDPIIIIPETVTNKDVDYSVTAIGDKAFADCKKVTAVTIPASVTAIGKHAFSFCKAMKSIAIPASVTSIGEYAFHGCKKLESVTIPPSVKTIEKSVFGYCDGLYIVKIPDTVTSIGESAFTFCNNLTEITIGSSVTTIGTGAFNYCRYLKNVYNYSNLDIRMGDKSLGGVALYAGKVYNCKEPAVKSFDVKAPPILNIAANSIRIEDGNNNNIINANEMVYLKFRVENTGEGTAVNCVAKVNATGSSTGLGYNDVKLPTIATGQAVDVSIPISADNSITDGEVNFRVVVDEPNGFGCDPITLAVTTRQFEAPQIQVSDYSITSESGTTLSKRVPFDLQLLVQNVNHGDADDVNVSITLPPDVMIMERPSNEKLGDMKGGSSNSLVYTLIVNNRYVSNTIPVTVKLSEKYGKYAESKTINLALNQNMATNKIVINSKENLTPKNITIAQIANKTRQSDVDIDIPQGEKNQDNTFVVIIGNEDYQRVEKVPFAKSDAMIFAEYCHKTLGIEKKNINTYYNATFGNMRSAVNYMKDVAQAYNGDIKVIFYYAGHGMPDENSKSAYLLPVDADGRDASVCYPVGKLYKDLGELNARCTIVLLDACFSGAMREGGMIASARGIAIKAKEDEPMGNMVVISAASGEETALPFKEQSHGLFTYYLLKQLQTTTGNVSLGDLSDYIINQVKRTSVVDNHKSQTPTVMASPSLTDSWRTIKLK